MSRSLAIVLRISSVVLLVVLWFYYTDRAEKESYRRHMDSLSVDRERAKKEGAQYV